MNNIIFHTNSAWTLLHFRSSLMLALKSQGYHVIACAPEDENADSIREMGIEFLHVPVSQTGQNPIQETSTIFRLFDLYRHKKPILVHHFSVKPILYGTLTAYLARVPIIINTFTGLGYAFGHGGLQWMIVQALLRANSRAQTWTTFQNPDDFNLLTRKGLINAERATVIPGSGVDTQYFVPEERVGQSNKTITFLMFSRMMWAKGVREYVEAASRVRQEIEAIGKGDRARFVLMGGADSANTTNVSQEWLANPDTIPGNWLEQHSRSGAIHYYPHDDNVKPYIQNSDVVVLPSYYPEGLPRSLIEAMSCGKAIITTNTPGCRQVVEERVNGLLVEPRDTLGLVRAMKYMINHPLEVRRMGEASRRLVLERFSEEVIISKTFDVYKRAGLHI